MTTDAQRRATAKWQKANTKAITVRFTPSQMDVYEHIKKQPNQAAYIMGLVRSDMKH